MSTTNLEEAATVASEFISSLDNLPAEVNYLLAEMKHKDVRTQELLSEIQKESAKYVRHSLRSGPSQPLSAKDSAIPTAVQAHYLEIDKLAEEKERLAERIVQLVARARTRLDCDLSRVLVLQGEPELATQPGFYYGSSVGSQLNDSLRGVATLADIPATPASVSQGAPAQKKRRTGMGAVSSAVSIKLPSPAPPTIITGAQNVGAAGQRSRLSQQVSARSSPAARGRHAAAAAAMAMAAEADEDAEGDEDIEDDGGDENGDAEDTEIYCFCQKMSYGEMIACDGTDCRYQWFHLDCVNLKPPLPDQWFCSDCEARGNALKLGGGPERRKGRKK